MTMKDKTTHFGFQDVPYQEKVKKVAGVFHSVADKYDVMNDLMSFGIHRVWKRYTIEMSGVRAGHHVLDLAGGTGDLAAKFARLVGAEGSVTLADINDSMLKVGRERLTDKGILGNVQYVQANAECLPFPDNHFDAITIAFGLRNVTDKDKALQSMFRVLKPGGKLLVLEFSKPNKMLAPAYDIYSFKLLPLMGKLVAGGKNNPIKELYSQYQLLLVEAMRLKTTIRKHSNVLQHLMGYFKKQLTADEKQELLEVFDNYRNELVPLIVPITLINHYVRKYNQPYLQHQTYLNPHPMELKLRTHV